MEFDKALILNSDFFSPVIDPRPSPIIAITKGVPAPRGRRAKYPFPAMEIGDSFFAPGSSVIGIHGCARRHRPMRFTCRSIVEDGVAGIRVWRIS
ncbi:MAG: hypothetical protein WCJ41_10150 [Aestuariivirga sp.]|uniref:hypothetical protein n=1 Tax=Aestuariivirga sp. TaxID=2650926 RepID=UPI0030175676